MKKLTLLLTLFLLGSVQLTAQVLLTDKKFDAEGVKRLEVDGSFISVRLSGTSDDKVSVEGRIEGPKRYKGDIEIKSDLRGTTLRVWVDRPRNIYGNIRGKISIEVPEGTVVDAENSSGSLYAEDLKGSEISLSASSGSLEANNIEGNINLRTSSGRMSAKDLKGNTVARTSSGGLKIVGLRGNLEARTSSGRLSLEDLREGDVTGRTSSGGISMERVSGRLSLESSSGGIRGSDIELTGDSNFQATSGSISLNLRNDIDQMSFDLKSSSGSIRAGGRRGEDRLVLKRGGVAVTGKTSSGSISFR